LPSIHFLAWIYTGYVVGLTAFSVGEVITKGDKILDVVPEQESLVIEGRSRSTTSARCIRICGRTFI
jgi:hypothetical protein